MKLIPYILVMFLCIPAEAIEFHVEMDDKQFESWAHKTAGWFHFFGSHSDKKVGESEKEYALRKIQEETGMVIKEVVR